MYACPDCHGPTRPPAAHRDGRCPRCHHIALMSAVKRRRARAERRMKIAAWAAGRPSFEVSQ